MAKSKNSFFEKVEAEVLEGATGYIKEKVGSKVVKWGEFSLFVLLAFICISIGVAELIGFYFSELSMGFNYILLGMLFLILSVFIRM